MRAVGMFIAVLGLGGCELLDMFPGPTPEAVEVARVYRAETVDGHKVRRVGIVPLTDLTGHPDESEAVARALVSALRAKHPLDVISLPEDILSSGEEQDFREDATIHQDTLMRLKRDFNVDAIVFGKVTHYRAYTPMLLGLELDMFSTGAGDVIWEVDAVYDAANDAVVRDVHNYHDTTLAPTDSLEDYRLILMSPRRFTDYACSRIAATL